MKNLLIALVLIMVHQVANAQVPSKWNYQATIKGADGKALVDQEMAVRLSLLKNDEIVYAEAHDRVVSNNFGNINLLIGNGVVDDNYATALDQLKLTNGSYTIKVELDSDTSDGIDYVDFGESPIVTVPFAQHAETVAQNDDADADPNNELQTLSLDGNVLSLSKGNSLALPGLTDTDDQSLSFDGENLSIEGGNTINLTPLLDGVSAGGGTDNQNLELSGTLLSIEDGNVIDLSAVQDGTEDADADPNNEIQVLGYDAASYSLSLSNGGSVDLSNLKDTGSGGGSDDQQLSLAGNILKLENGGEIDLSALVSGGGGADDQVLSLDGTKLVLENGGEVDLAALLSSSSDGDGDATNELQAISYDPTTNILTLEGGGEVDLSDLQDASGGGSGTDDQQIVLDGSILKLEDGGEVDLSILPISINDADADPSNEIQQLELVNNEITISDGNTIDLTPILAGGGADDQTISYDPTTNILTLEDGGEVDLSDLQDVGGGGAGTDDQQLVLDGSILKLEDGGEVDLTTLPDATEDADADPANEIQMLELINNEITISNGNTIDLSPILTGGADDQTISYDPTTNVLTLEDGGEVDLSDLQDAGSGGSGTDDQQLVLDGAILKLEDGGEVDLTTIPDAVDDADADPVNELQTISFDAATNELAISDGNTITIPTGGSDADADPANELQDIELAGTSLSITDGSTVDLSSLQDDADADPANELQTLSFDAATNEIEISGGNKVAIPTGGSDADADPTNELQDIELVGTSISIDDGSTIDLAILQDGVDDADADPSNEIQTLSFDVATNEIEISGGNKITIPTGGSDADADPTNELQDIELVGTSLSIDDGSTIDLAILQDGVEDADADPMNELQELIYNAEDRMLFISDGDDEGIFLGGSDGGSDDQELSFANGQMTIEDGNEVLIDHISNLDNSVTVESSSASVFVKFDGDQKLEFTTNANGDLNIENPGSSNWFMGNAAGRRNVTGVDNIAIGFNSMHSNTQGAFNVAVGNLTLSNNDADALLAYHGAYNTAIGHAAGLANTLGSDNVFIGFNAGNSNTTGRFNTILGSNAGRENEIGESNVFIGQGAGRNNTGEHNTLVGTFAGGSEPGNNNVHLGYSAGQQSEGNNNIFIGYSAGRTIDESERLFIENSADSRPLIYGEFDNDYLRINGTFNINGAYDFPTDDPNEGDILSAGADGNLRWAAAGAGSGGQSLTLMGSQLGITGGNTVDLFDFTNKWYTIEDGGTMPPTEIGVGYDKQAVVNGGMTIGLNDDTYTPNAVSINLNTSTAGNAINVNANNHDEAVGLQVAARKHAMKATVNASSGSDASGVMINSSGGDNIVGLEMSTRGSRFISGMVNEIIAEPGAVFTTGEAMTINSVGTTTGSNINITESLNSTADFITGQQISIEVIDDGSAPLGNSTTVNHFGSSSLNTALGSSINTNALGDSRGMSINAVGAGTNYGLFVTTSAPSGLVVVPQLNIGADFVAGPAAAISDGIVSRGYGNGAVHNSFGSTGDRPAGTLDFTTNYSASRSFHTGTFSTNDGSSNASIAAGVVGISSVDMPSGGQNAGLVGVAQSSSNSNIGVIAHAETTAATGITYGILSTAVGSSPATFAGVFQGNVHVEGIFSKSGGTFKIDHPDDPENKYLSHSFVESPDMMNIYNGNVTTDDKGYAKVTLPDYFESLNIDFRYQLTVIGTFAQAIVAEEIINGVFTVQTNEPNVKVSWQVTGVRNDPWARANRVMPVEHKGMSKGTYLNPEVYGKDKLRSQFFVDNQYHDKSSSDNVSTEDRIKSRMQKAKELSQKVSNARKQKSESNSKF